MTRRTILGATAAAAATLALGVSAFAHGAGFGRHGSPRMMQAIVDDALDAANATPEQRARVEAAWTRVREAITAARGEDRGAQRDRLLTLFEADQIDAASLAALRQETEAAHRQVADAVQQAIVETHAALSPDQRKAVADQVRSFRPGRHRQ
jgi:Spy/CpxP family protein refolding chaperone